MTDRKGTNRKYQVELSAEERSELESIVRRRAEGAGKLRRARILLLADTQHPDGRRTDATISELVNLSERQVVRIRQRFVKERQDQPLEQACERKPRPPAPERKRLDGEGEAQLIAVACSDPPEGRDCWTLELLCDELVRQGVVESICRETVRQSLKKTNCSPGGRSGSAFPPGTGRRSSHRWR